VARNDRLRVGVPHRPDRTTAPAPIMRAVENYHAAQQHRRSSSATTDQGIDIPHRINTSSRGGGGRDAPRPPPLGPTPGTEGVPRTMPNVAAYQQARDGVRLGRISAAPPTRNNQYWRRGGRSAILGQAREPLPRGDSRQPDEHAGHGTPMTSAEWRENYLSTNSYAIDNSAFPDVDAASELPSTVTTQASDRPRPQAAAPDMANTAPVLRGLRRSTGFAYHEGVMNYAQNAIANGSAGRAEDSTESVHHAVNALQDALEQTAPTEVTDVAQPHDENLFNPEPGDQAGAGPGNDAMDPYAASLLQRVAPRLHGPVRRDVASALETDDAIDRGRAPRPAHSTTSSGASLVRRALRHIMITNNTESRNVRNRRRANDVGLQNALDILGANDFASPEDRFAWDEEWARQSLARAPKKLPNRRPEA